MATRTLTLEYAVLQRFWRLQSHKTDHEATYEADEANIHAVLTKQALRKSPSLYCVQLVQEFYQEYVVIELPGPAPDGHCERSNDNLHQEEVQHKAGPQVPEQWASR